MIKLLQEHRRLFPHIRVLFAPPLSYHHASTANVFKDTSFSFSPYIGITSIVVLAVASLL